MTFKQEAQNGIIKLDGNETRKFIRKQLKNAFPDVKFSVRKTNNTTTIKLVDGDVDRDALMSLLAQFPSGHNTSDAMRDHFSIKEKPLIIDGQVVQLHWGYANRVYPDVHLGGYENHWLPRYARENQITPAWAFTCDDCGKALQTDTPLCKGCQAEKNAIDEPDHDPRMMAGTRVAMDRGFLVLGGETGTIEPRWDRLARKWRYYMVFDNDRISSRTVDINLVNLL